MKKTCKAKSIWRKSLNKSIHLTVNWPINYYIGVWNVYRGPKNITNVNLLHSVELNKTEWDNRKLSHAKLNQSSGKTEYSNKVKSNVQT